jgi:hypothetical protein
MASIPSFVRAYLGLLDTAVQAARDLREHAPELPVEAVGNAMQLSLKTQQRFTELAIRGDDVISRFRGAPDEAPAWATFDDEPAARADPPVPTADDAVATALGELADRRSATEPTQASTLSPRASMVEAVPATKVPAKKASSRKAPAAQPTLAPRASMVESVPARKIPATKIPVKKPVKNGASMVEIQHPASKTPTTKPVKTGASMVEIQRGAKKSPARKAPARKTPARKAPTVPAGPASVSPASVSPASESARAQSAFDLTPDPHEPTNR